MYTQNRESIVIRDAAPGDVEAINDIEQVSIVDPWSKDAISGAFGHDYSMNLVALDKQGILRGYIFCDIIADEINIIYLVTHLDFRRRGIARRLVAAAIEKARLAGVRNCYLEVRSKNVAAIALYVECGFTLQSLRKKYYANDDDDAQLMALQL